MPRRSARSGGVAGRLASSHPGFPGYAHLPAWAKGWVDLFGNNPGNHLYVGGTSQATPHVSGIAALMFQKDPTLTPAEVQSILRSTAIDLPAGSAQVWDPFAEAAPQFVTYSWGDNATGSGLVQADAALAAVP